MAEHESEEQHSGDRKQPLREVVRRFLEALHAGQNPRISDWIARYPELGPGLAKRLERAAAIYRGMQSSTGKRPDWAGLETHVFTDEGGAAGASQEAPAGPVEDATQVATPHDRAAVGASLGIRCPHCGHRIQIVASGDDTEITCRSCGSSFHFDSAIVALTREPKQPRNIGRFAILEKLGRGGFGVVYKASDPLLSRYVAVKTPRAGYFATAEDEERFFREARSAARLRHAHIVRIHEVDRHHGVPYIVSEFIEGTTFADVLAKQRLSFRESVDLVIAVAEALEYAHQQHVVHRDIKPSNILIDTDWHPYVTDFGLARRDDSEITITVEGQVLGTPAYMSPEQAAGEQARIDRRCDIYSLGIVLYHAICGNLPFRGSRRMLVQQVIHDEPQPPRRINEHIPRDLETITLKAIAKDPERRYATAKEFAADLRRWQNHEPIRARPVSRAERVLRWCRRNPVVAGLAVTIGVLLWGAVVAASIWAWREGTLRTVAEQARGRAETSEQLSRDQLVLMQLRNGGQQMDAGNYLLALLWGSEAMRVEANHRQLTPHHRLQLGLLLDRCPTLLQVWDRPGKVNCAEFNAAGDRVLAASDDGSLIVFNPETGRPVTPEMKQDVAVTWATFDGAGDRLVSVGLDNIARLWNARTGECTARLAHEGRPVHAVFSPDGQLVATAGLDGFARVWDAATGAKVTELKHADSLLNMVLFSPDGSLLLTAAKNSATDKGELRLWRPATGESVGSVMPHDLYVWHATFNHDGTRLVSASQDRTVRQWNGQTGEPIGGSLPHDTPVSRVFFADGDRRIISATDDGQVRIWDAATGALQQASIQHGGFITAARLSQSQVLLATGGSNGQTRIWSWASGWEMSPPSLQSALVSSVAFDAADRRLLVASHDGTVKLWDLAASVPSVLELAHDGAVTRGRFGPDGTRLLTTSDDKTARLWSTDTGTPTCEPMQHDHSVVSGVFSPDGALVATISGQSGQMWEVNSGAAVGPPLEHAGQVMDVAFHPDGQLLVTAGRDGSAKAWSAKTRELQYVLTHKGGITSVAFSPDGRWIATAGEDGTVQLWNAVDGQPAGGRLQHDDLVHGCSFSPDSRYLLTASRDQAARIWHVADGTPASPPLPHVASVWPTEFSSDGSAFLTGDLHGSTLVWQLGLFDAPRWSFLVPDHLTYAASFAPHGDLVASALGRQSPGSRSAWGDGSACLWDVTTGLLLAPPFFHRGAVMGVEFHRRGDLLLTASADHTARLWRLRTVDQPMADVTRLAQLLSGMRIDERCQLVALEAGSLRSELDTLRERYPDALTSPPEDVATWQRWLAREAALATSTSPEP